ncbi:MAG: fused MFS/spermidine synthase [Candidatus Aminicenantes bacterium]|nr:fused MFS/spermidine synthase [Candidatus Aminicenantes bacterium]
MSYVIPLAYAALGAFGMVMQTILLREFFVVAAGNEISFGIAMAGWLLGVGAGSLAGAFFARRRSSTAAAFSWVALAMGIVAPLLLAAARSLHRLADVPQGGLLPLVKTFYLIPLLTLPFSALSGFAFPLAARLRPMAQPKTARAMAWAYAWESLGAMAGGLAYTFWLVGRWDPVSIIALYALPLLAGAWIVSCDARGRVLRAALLLAFGLGLASLGGWALRFEEWLVKQRWRGISASTLVAARDSRYQNLQLGLAHGQYSLFANGQLAASFPDEAADRVLAAQLLTQHPRPRNVLVIGDVFAGLARHLLRYPIASLTAVEIDAGYSDLILEHLGPEERSALRDHRLRARRMDGRRFVLLAARGGGGARERYDLVLIHQPDAWTAQINRYYTREFFQDLREILAPGGVVALRLASAENYASEIVTPYTAAIYRTLRSVFPVIAVSPGMSNFFFASGSRSSVSDDAVVLARRYQALAPPPASLAPIFASLYPPEKGAYIRSALEREKGLSLNRDNRPIAYFLGSRLLGWSSGSPLSGLFALLRRITVPGVLLGVTLLLLPLLAVALLRRGSGANKVPTMVAAACGGFAGLSIEITAIFIFQNTWGFVYQAVGMLIALFMLGLGCGALWTGRWLERKTPVPRGAGRRLALVLLAVVVINATFIALLRLGFQPGWPGQLALALWLGGMGVLGGAILPLGLRVLGRMAAGPAAGLLNAGDYLGGAIGSLLMAAFFLPLLGTSGGLLIICFLAAVAAALLLVTVPGEGPRGREGTAAGSR